ncbi:YoaK family protein [Microbacterium sp. P05]|uniref:YoaK family protein n=1 Tax=Microbacterium sp. P05 TaxID=3366948 RepID=UPI0037456605
MAQSSAPSSAPQAHPREKVVHTALVLLAFSAGATDAFAFLALGGIFTGMMTGNLVLSGIFTRPEYWHTVVGAATAVLSFAGGAYFGFRMFGTGGAVTPTPASVARRLLLPSIVAQALGAVVWALTPAPAGLLPQCIIVALLAIALSLQTVAAKMVSDVTGITTTYVTGTITTTMQQLADRKVGGTLIRILTLLTLPLGAICATALLTNLPWSAPLLPLACSAIAALLLHRALAR